MNKSPIPKPFPCLQNESFSREGRRGEVQNTYNIKGE